MVSAKDKRIWIFVCLIGLFGLLMLSGCGSAGASNGNQLQPKTRPDSVNKTLWYKGKEYLDAYMKADNNRSNINSNLAIEIKQFNNKNGLAILGIDSSHTKLGKEIIKNVYWMSSQYAIYLGDKSEGKNKEAKKILDDYKKARDKLIQIYYKKSP